ncbi:MAG: hypothetical protein R3B06_06640 [Kofleriaceae bacterium]
MSAAVGLGLFSDWEVGEADYGTWVDATTVTDGLLAPLLASGELDRATHYWVDDVEPHPLPARSELMAMASRWRQETVAIFAGELDQPSWRFQFGLHRTGVRVSLELGPAYVDATTRDHIEALVRTWSGALGPRCGLTLATVVPAGAPYRRVMPPRDSAWTLGAIDYYLGQRWHGADGGRAAVLAAVRAAPVPDGGVRTDADDVVRVGFAAELADAAAVGLARTASEAWLAPLVPTTNERGWNDAGDKMVVASNRIELAPFTFFDASSHVGYKALIVDPDDGAIDEDAWAALVAVARTGHAPDGTPVRAVRAVFPVRADALAMHARVVADGLEMSTYPGGPVFWQVHPDPAISD